MKNIGKNIQKLRNEIGLTQAQLAEKVDFSANHISRIEIGASAMSLESLISLSNALNTTPDYLLFGEYEITPDRALLFISEKLKDLTTDEKEYIIGAIDVLRVMKINRK